MNIKFIIKSAFLSTILVIISASLFAQWKVPKEAMTMKFPTEVTYESVKKGKDLYYTKQGLNCLSCHGDPGKANFKAGLNAPDLGAKNFQEKNTVGEIFYKIKTGMGAMPSFANIHSDDEIRDIVIFVKSFDESFKISGEKIEAYNGLIELKTDEEARKVYANITLTDDKGNTKPNNGVEILFFVKRYFGNLPLGEAVPTNEEGRAAIDFPDDMPGDVDGKITVITTFKDADAYGADKKSLDLNWGTPLHFKNEVLERTLWGPNNRVPLWLLFTYWAITGGVWLGIFYVIYNLTRIKKAGK